MAYHYAPYMINTPYLWPYYQQPVITPFIPPNIPLPSPNAGAGTRQVRFEDGDNGGDVYRTGRRPPSWHAGIPGPVSPTHTPYTTPPFVYTTLPPVMGAPFQHHGRRLSDTALPPATWVHPGWMVYPQIPRAPSPRPTFNPLLNGEPLDGPLLLFDLSSSLFEPARISHHGASHSTRLTEAELTETATWPSVTRMEISCDEIPQWKVILEPQSSAHKHHLAVPAEGATPPITVYDVLFSIHRMLQRQVTHKEWYELSQYETTAVARAYTRRCKTVSTIQAFEESQGVRRVDYLKDKYIFKGLVREQGREGFERVRLRVGKK